MAELQAPELEQLINTHANWVYASARRRVGRADVAEDVTQAVFILLWRKWPGLKSQTRLTGWLYRAVGYCSANAMRLRRLRRAHEREAAMSRPEQTTSERWSDIEEELESAVGGLREKDRQVILLRFYRGMSHLEAGQALGISEEAAKMRVGRAIERLRVRLEGRGVAASSAGLSAIVLANVSSEAPGRFVERMPGAIGGGGGSAAASAIAKGAMKMMAWAKLKVAAVVVVVAAAAVAGGQSLREESATVAPVTRPTAELSEMRKLAAKIADEMEAQIARTTRLGYLFRTDHGLPTDDDMAAKRIGSPRMDVVSEAGEYAYDAKSGREYLLRASRPDEAAYRNESEVSGLPGRWTTLRSEAPGSTSRWAKVTDECPYELTAGFRIGYPLMGTSSLPEVIRTAQDIQIGKDALDGEECYCVAMIARPRVRMQVNGTDALVTAFEAHRIWLSISHGLMPIRSEEYYLDLDKSTPRSPDQWTVGTMLKQERLSGVTLQLGLQKMSNGAWLPSRRVSYSFGPDHRWGSQTTYDRIMVNDDVTVKTVTIPAGAWKGVMKDMLRK